MEKKKKKGRCPFYRVPETQKFVAQEAGIRRQFEALRDSVLKFVPLNDRLRMDSSISRRIQAACAVNSPTRLS
jgi:hypothetical protein